MMEKTMENNRVSVIGEVASEFTFSHEVYGEGFYLTTVLVNRLSNQVDEIPVDGFGAPDGYSPGLPGRDD